MGDIDLSVAGPVSQYYVPGTASLPERRARTLKHGDAFALFDYHGDASGDLDSPEGVYFRDTRFLSTLAVTLERTRPLLLSSTMQSDNAALRVDLTNPDLYDAAHQLVLAKNSIHLARTTFLADGACHALFALRNFSEQARRIELALAFDADFADLFEVRGFQRASRGKVAASVSGNSVTYRYAALDGIARATELSLDCTPLELGTHHARFAFDLKPRERRAFTLTIRCLPEGNTLPRSDFFAALRKTDRALRRTTRAFAAVQTSDSVVNEILDRSVADLVMLLTETAAGSYPYAGIPWYSTAFGRDGLITAIEMLWCAPWMARGVLRFLAQHQASRDDRETAAEPGKILHEMRQGELAHLGEIPFGRYYGSVDATPLFVVLAGLYWQRTADIATLKDIWPHLKAAMAWIDGDSALDADGFLKYGRNKERGLTNQGWKDSEDAVFHANGDLARAPIALAEVQGYVYLARLAAAQMARAMHEDHFAQQLLTAAEALRRRFEADFWLDEIGCYAIAIDASHRPCAVRTSNAGQVLFSGIAATERAAKVAAMMMGADFFSGWGIRTLGLHEARFNPASYHNGSIWPHDNALIAMGLARYGYKSPALQIAAALFEAAAQMDLRRIPELYCGFHRKRGVGPVLYPVACAPQAWAAAAPQALIGACLGLEFDALEPPHGVLRLIHPRLPTRLDWMRLSGLAIRDSHFDLMLRRHGDDVAVDVERRHGSAKLEVVL